MYKYQLNIYKKGTYGNTKFNTTKYAIHCQIEDSQDEQFSKERQHPCSIAKLPSRTASMNVGVVVAGGTSGNHRHYYESLIYIIKGNGYSVVEGNKVVQFLCGTNAPLLQSVGEIDCREEAG